MATIAHKTKDKEALKRYAELCRRIAADNQVNPFEDKKDQLARISRAKKDFGYMVETYFKHYAESETPDFHIRISRKVRRSKTYKGWLKWARGHAKSVVAIVLLPIWLWMNGEVNFLLVVGQNEDKAKILLGDLQAEFEHNPLLINDFGVQHNVGSWTDGLFVTNSGFIAKAIGCGQDPRGIRVGPHRPDMIVADDWETRETAKNPMRQNELTEWFLRGVIPTADAKGARVLICQNHWTPRMIFSMIIEELKGWDVDQVNAYNPVDYMPTWSNKYDRWFFKTLEQELGVLRVLAEYNNQPHIEGKLFLDSYFQWTKLPALKSMDAICGRWDVAYAGTPTSDYNAIRIWGLKDGKKYLIDCFVKQCKMKEALRWMAYFQKNLKENINCQIGFESQFWNDEVYRSIEEIETEEKIKLNLIKIDRRTGSKYDHIITMLPQYQNGRVFFNEKLKNHNDTTVGTSQIKGIEPGYKTKDDAPDADVYAFDYLDSFQNHIKSTHKTGKAESRKY
jgi:phage terminase large subunit-like protein